MKVIVKNYRAIKQAEIEVDPIALLCGPNESGKTSTAQAIAIALTGEPVVLDDVHKSEAGSLVHRGAEGKCSIEVIGAAGSATITLPTPGRVKTNGTPPRASAAALGLAPLMAMSSADRTKTLIRLLKAEPDRADLQAALPEIEDVGPLWEKIEAQGWDGAHAGAVEKGKTFKGRWEGITGENFGAVKIQQYIPVGWSEDLDGASLETLQQQLADAESLRDAAISQTAVSDDERARLVRLAETEPALQAAVEAQEIATHDTQRVVAELRAKRDGIPAIGDPPIDTWLSRRQKLKEIVDAHDPAELRQKIDATEAAIEAGKTEHAALAAKVEALPRPAPVLAAALRRLSGKSIEGQVGKCPHCGADVMCTENGDFIAPPTGVTKRQAAAIAKQNAERAEALGDAMEKVHRKLEAIDKLVTELSEIRALLNKRHEAEKELADIPPAPDASKWEADKAEHDRLVAHYDAEIEKMAREASEEVRKLGALDAQLIEARSAAARIKAAPAALEGDVEQYREAARLAAERIAVWQKKTGADRVARQIMLNQRLVKALAPSGVRESKLSHAVSAFNERLNDLTRMAGWKPCEFDRDLNLSYGGHEWRFLSTGAKFRVEALIQLATAQLDGSEIAVIDGADVLDSSSPKDKSPEGTRRGRAGLIALLMALKIPAIVCMTTASNAVPQLRAFRVRSYWLEDGTARLDT